MVNTTDKSIRGVIPAILTPMDESGSVDYGLLEKQARYLSEAGVNGFFIGGTTAEGAYLSTEEKGEIIRVVRDVIEADQFLCAAYIQPSTRAVLEEMAALRDTAPDFVVAVTPYYLPMRQEDIVEHYQLIAREASAPLLLYDIPGNTHNPIDLETILALAEEKNITGIKDSSGNFAQFSEGVLGDSPDGFLWIQGSDALDGPSLMIGCDAVVTGLGNARVEPYVDMYRAAVVEDWQTVRECQARINQLRGIITLCGNSVSAVKAAAEIAGRGSRWMRQKSTSLSGNTIPAVADLLEEFDRQYAH
jgi:4-hydroxy-tetrahydrodipicolinate synthase